MSTHLREASAGQEKPREVLSVFAHANIVVVNAPATPVISTRRIRRTCCSTSTPTIVVPVSVAPKPVVFLERERGALLWLLLLSLLRRRWFHRRCFSEAHGTLEMSGTRGQRGRRCRMQLEGLQASVQVRPHAIEVVRRHEHEPVAAVVRVVFLRAIGRTKRGGFTNPRGKTTRRERGGEAKRREGAGERKGGEGTNVLSKATPTTNVRQKK